jgi:pimeloyl-ACP methyl ester carboxylesterase
MTNPPHFETITTAGPTRPWLTLVHGASQHSGLFNAQVKEFQPNYRLLLIDLPGHGRSSTLPGPSGLVEYTRSTLAALRATKIDRTHYWGTHTGAGIGLMLAAEHPQLIESLILDGSILPGIDLPYVTERYQLAKKTARARGIEAARAEWFRESKWFDVMREKPTECRAKEHWELVDEFPGRPWLDTSTPETIPSIRPALKTITQPTLLINGEHDVEGFIRVADELEASLPNVKRATIQGAGGFPLWEFPTEVNALVKQFLD